MMASGASPKVGGGRRADRRAARAPARGVWALRVPALLAGLLLPLGCLEALMRTLPVHGGTHRLSVDAENPVVRFAPNREFVWSRDWNFSIVNRVKINNFGFASDFDYDADAETPLVAVIGDSYVEAFMVPYSLTCAGRLAARFDGRARVYSFAASGAPLSQYLAYAEYVRKMFRPDGLAIVVVNNDFDESFRKYGLKPGMHQFVERSNGGLVLQRNDNHIGFWYRLARASALARYLVANLRVTGGGAGRQLAGRPEGAPARREELEPVRIADSRRAADVFLDRLPEASGLAPGRIVFVVDGIRPRVYADDGAERANGSYEDVMRRYFMGTARRRGYETIDLEPAFARHFRAHQARFDWPQDQHWNALGHEVCFEAVVRSALLSRGLLPAAGSGRKHGG